MQAFISLQKKIINHQLLYQELLRLVTFASPKKYLNSNLFKFLFDDLAWLKIDKIFNVRFVN